MSRTALLLSFSVVCVCLLPTAAEAFAEDVCFAEGGGLVNCSQTRCRPGDESPRCQWASALGWVSGTTVAVGGRSAVHVDATYYLAQAVGFDSTTAYWIAAYDEATDLGQYVPYNSQGLPMVDVSTCGTASAPPACSLVTANINGVVRTNFPSGGLMMHFVVPFNPTGAPVNGLNPDLQSTNSPEWHLKNLRAWVYQAQTACVAGLPWPGSSQSYCESPTLHVTGYLPMLPSGPDAYVNSKLGEQPVQTGGQQPQVPASNLATLTGVNNVTAARLGIYLHSLQDRISHHVCTDASSYHAPQTAGADYTVDFHPDECDQLDHSQRHSWETGTLQSTLPVEHRTTEPALAKTYDELLAFAAYLGRSRPVAHQSAYRQQVLQIALRALEQPEAAARVQQMATRMRAFDPSLVPMPGH